MVVETDNICKIIKVLVDNIFVQFGGCLFRQIIGILKRTNCAQFLADLFHYSYKDEFFDNMIRSGHSSLARSFNLCNRSTDDLIFLITRSFGLNYIDLTFMTDNGSKLSTRRYKKHNDFDFYLVDFTFLFSNIPSGPFYGA